MCPDYVLTITAVIMFLGGVVVGMVFSWIRQKSLDKMFWL